MLKIGCAKVDITPDFPVYLRGYASRNELSNAIEERLSAGIMLLAQGRSRHLLLTVDSLGIGIRECERIYRDLEKATGYKEAQIYLACSHTHFAPGLDDDCVIRPGGKLKPGIYPAEPEYYPFFLGQLVRGIAEAEKSLEAVSLEETAIPVPSVLFNRRTIERKSGKVVTNYLYPENPEDYRFQPVDPELMVWRFKKTDGGIKAIVGRFGCHAVTGGRNQYAISADYPGYFQTFIQKEFGCPGYFLLGTAGDVVPLQRNGSSRQDIADVLVKSIRLAERTFHKVDEFKLEGTTIQVPVTLRVKCSRQDADKILAKVLKENEGANFDGDRCLLGVYAVHNVKTYPKDRVELPLRLLRLGDRVLVGMPFEVLTEIGLRLRKSCPNAILTSITGGYEGYLPLAKDYRLGGYESTLGAQFNCRAGDDFLKAAIAAVKAFG